MDTIYKRRSIRKYTSQVVPEKSIMEFIRAGMNAPSAGNQQPWHFVVINERKLLDEIPKVHPYSQMLYQASTAILVCGDANRNKTQTMPGGAVSTWEIEVPANWDKLMAELRYPTLRGCFIE